VHRESIINQSRINCNFSRIAGRHIATGMLAYYLLDNRPAHIASGNKPEYCLF